MAEQEEGTEVPVEAEVIEETPDEIKAREGGWVPENEWVEQGNDAKDWKTAKHFNEIGEVYRKTSNLSRNNKQLKAELDEMREQMQTFVNHHKKVAEYERDKVIKELEQGKVQAMDEGDNAKVVEYERKIREAEKTTVDVPDVKPARNSAEQIAQEWVANNQWYSENLEMRNKANILMQGYVAANPGADPEDVFEYAENEIKASNPAYFKPKPNKPKVESGNGKPPPEKKGKYPKLNELDENTRGIVKNFAETWGVDTDQYIKELVDTGQL